MNKQRLLLLTFAFGLLHLVLTVVVGVLVGMCEIGANWGDGAGNGADGLSTFLYVLIRVLQPLLAVFSWLTGELKPLPLHHRDTFLLALDLLVAIATSCLFGFFAALLFSRKRRSQHGPKSPTDNLAA